MKPSASEKREITCQLVADAASGDMQALEELFSLLLPLFHRMAKVACDRHCISPEPDTLEDLSQDTVIHLLADDARRLRTWLAHQMAPFEHYVAAVAANKLDTAVRDLARRRYRELVHLVDVVVAEEQKSEFEECVQRSMEKLPEDERRLLIQRYCEGMSSRTIADESGLTVQQVYQLTYSAERRLRELVTAELRADV